MPEIESTLGLNIETKQLNEFFDKMKEIGTVIQELSTDKPLQLGLGSSADTLDDIKDQLALIDTISQGIDFKFAKPEHLTAFSDIHKIITNIQVADEGVLQQLKEQVVEARKIADATENEVVATQEVRRALEHKLELEAQLNAQLKENKKQLKDIKDAHSDIASDVEEQYKKKAKEAQDIAKQQAKQIKTLSDVERREYQILKEKEKQLANQKSQNEQLTFLSKRLAEMKKTIKEFKPLKFGFNKVLEQLKEVFSVVKTMMPLFALLSVGKLIQEMVEVDKQVKDLYKSYAHLSHLQSKSSHAFSADHFKKEMRAIRKSVMDFAGRWKVSFDEANENLKSVVDSGILLEEVLGKATEVTTWSGAKITKYSMGVADDIKSMSVSAGKSFGDMAQTVVSWRNDLGVSIKSSRNVFTQLKGDAEGTGIATSKFFEKVMNASSGLVMYGARVQEVSKLLSDLAKTIDLPREKALELAKGLIKGAEDFTLQQKLLLASQGDIEKIARNRISELEKQKRVAVGDDLADIKKEINQIEGKLKLKDSFERRTQLFEVLGPTDIMKMQMTAMNKLSGIFQGVDMLDTEAMEKVLSENKTKLELIAPNYGMDMKTLVKVFEDMSANLQKSKTAQEILGIKHDHLTKAFKSNNVEGILEALESSGKPIKEVITALSAAGFGDIVAGLENMKPEEQKHVIAEGLAKLKTSFGDIGGRIYDKEARKKQKKEDEMAVGIAKQTQALETALKRMTQKGLFAVYDKLEDIRGMADKHLGFLSGVASSIWEGVKRIPGVGKFARKAEAIGLERTTTNEAVGVQTRIAELSEKLLNETMMSNEIQQGVEKATSEYNKVSSKEAKASIKANIDKLKEEQKLINDRIKQSSTELDINKKLHNELETTIGLTKVKQKEYKATDEEKEKTDSSIKDSARMQVVYKKFIEAMDQGLGKLSKKQQDSFEDSLKQVSDVNKAINEYTNALELAKKGNKEAKFELGALWESVNNSIDNIDDEALRKKIEKVDFEQAIKKMDDIDLKSWAKDKIADLKSEGVEFKKVEGEEQRQIIVPKKGVTQETYDTLTMLKDLFPKEYGYKEQTDAVKIIPSEIKVPDKKLEKKDFNININTEIEEDLVEIQKKFNEKGITIPIDIDDAQFQEALKAIDPELYQKVINQKYQSVLQYIGEYLLGGLEADKIDMAELKTIFSDYQGELKDLKNHFKLTDEQMDGLISAVNESRSKTKQTKKLEGMNYKWTEAKPLTAQESLGFIKPPEEKETPVQDIAEGASK